MEKSEIIDLTKTGMAVSMGLLVWTGMGKGRRSRPGRTLHTWAGIALIGFSVWHYHLYQPHRGS